MAGKLDINKLLQEYEEFKKSVTEKAKLEKEFAEEYDRRFKPISILLGESEEEDEKIKKFFIRKRMNGEII